MTWSITAVGTGSAFNTKDFQSNFLIEGMSGKKMLIDLGGFGPIALEKLGIHSGNVGEEIDAIYVSHLHGDHVGGIEWLAFCTYFNPKAPKPKLYCIGGNNGLMTQLWNKSLRGGLGSVEGKECTLTDYFEGHPLRVNETFEWDGLTFQPVQTIHVMNGMEIVPSYGLLIRDFHYEGAFSKKTSDPCYKLFLTTDTQFCPSQIEKFYAMADVILHDCETAPYYSKVHAHYDDLMTLPKETKAKMWLYHYQPNPPQDPQADGFQGFLERGQKITWKESGAMEVCWAEELATVSD